MVTIDEVKELRRSTIHHKHFNEVCADGTSRKKAFTIMSKKLSEISNDDQDILIHAKNLCSGILDICNRLDEAKKWLSRDN